MKKWLLFLVVIFISTAAYATVQNVQDENDSRVLFYKSIGTCTPITVDLSGKYFAEKYFVYGKKGNKCHIKEEMGRETVSCILPMDVAKKYSSELLRMHYDSFTKGSASSSYVNQIINSNYCN